MICIDQQTERFGLEPVIFNISPTIITQLSLDKLFSKRIFIKEHFFLEKMQRHFSKYLIFTTLFLVINIKSSTNKATPDNFVI